MEEPDFTRLLDQSIDSPGNQLGFTGQANLKGATNKSDELLNVLSPWNMDRIQATLQREET